MPSYEWICHKCKRANSADASACAHCGFSAFATGQEIANVFEEQARSGQLAAQSNETQLSQSSSAIDAAVKENECAGLGDGAKPKGGVTPMQAKVTIFAGVVLYLIDCYLNSPRHPDVPWIQSGMYADIGFAFDIVFVGVGLYLLVAPAD